MFQDLSLSTSIRTDPDLQLNIERASKILEDAIGKSAGLVRVHWDKRQDERNRDVVALTLKDWTGEVEGYFVPNDLLSTDRLYGRFYKLYGDLLQIRSHKLLDELLASPGQGGTA